MVAEVSPIYFQWWETRTETIVVLKRSPTPYHWCHPPPGLGSMIFDWKWWYSNIRFWAIFSPEIRFSAEILELKIFTVWNFRAKKISRISRKTNFRKVRENLISRISRKNDFLKISRKQIFANFANFFQIREIREN